MEAVQISSIEISLNDYNFFAKVIPTFVLTTPHFSGSQEWSLPVDSVWRGIWGFFKDTYNELFINALSIYELFINALYSNLSYRILRHVLDNCESLQKLELTSLPLVETLPIREMFDFLRGEYLSCLLRALTSIFRTS